MTKLQPKLSVVFPTPSCKFSKARKVRLVVQNQITGFFSVIWGSLHLTDDRYRAAAFSPALVKPDLFDSRIASAVTERV